MPLGNIAWVQCSILGCMGFLSSRHGTNKCEAPSNFTVTRFVRDADGMCRSGMFEEKSSMDCFNVTISTSLGGVSGIHFIACLGWPKNPYDQGGPDGKRRTKNSASFWICFVKCVSSKAYRNVWGQRPSEVAGDINWFRRSYLRRNSVSIPSIFFCTGCHAGPR